MVGVIWYRFVRCGGTDWSDTLVPIHPLQWYRFADIINQGILWIFQVPPVAVPWAINIIIFLWYLFKH